MHILIVQAHVKAEFIDAFKQATAVNAENSASEPGVAGFDFLQQQDDPARFVLYEVYRDASAPAKHKETAHYKAWVETVGPHVRGAAHARLLHQRLPGRRGVVGVTLSRDPIMTARPLILLLAAPLFAQDAAMAPAVLPGKGLAQHDFFYAGEQKQQQMFHRQKSKGRLELPGRR